MEMALPVPWMRDFSCFGRAVAFRNGSSPDATGSKLGNFFYRLLVHEDLCIIFISIMREMMPKLTIGTAVTVE